MIRLQNIVTIRVLPEALRAACLAVRCLSGRAKWSPDSRTLSLKADVIDDEALDKWADFLNSQPSAFGLELDCQTGASPEEISTSRFSRCAQATLELRSGTARPKGPATVHYYLRTVAEPSTSPNGVLSISSFILIESPAPETDDQFRVAVEGMLSEVYPRRPDGLSFSPGKRFARGPKHFREFACYAGSCAGLMMQRARRQGGLARAIIFRADDEGRARTYEICDGLETEFPPHELHPA
jgi:hypothetical protein